MNRSLTQLVNQAGRLNPDYVTSRANVINQVETTRKDLQQYWPPFITAAVESIGLLELAKQRDEVTELRSELQGAVTTLQNSTKEQTDQIAEKASSSIEEVRTEAGKIIESAKREAQEIEAKARQTAAKISVEEAQNQFKSAQSDLNRRVWFWGVLSLGLIGGFIWLAYHYSTVLSPEQLQWHVIYYTAIRLTILTAVGAIATFCLRVFRAHMHMSQLNLHRQRVANSMAAFVQSASTPEQRDLILGKLIESVVSFGESGLLSRERDAVTAPMVTIDAITKTFQKS